MTDDLNKHCSVHSGAGLKVERIVRECLIPFPYIWVSGDRVVIRGTWLMILDVAELLVGECQLLLTLFRSTDLTVLMLCSPVCECATVFQAC